MKYCRVSVATVLEEDPLLTGFDNSKIVFTDITYGVEDRERLIVVRDIDGTLRTATWEEHDRMNQIYYPREECKHYVPAMFEPDNLKALMMPEKTAEIVYNHINEHKHFYALESTRHFGPMVFYLCWNRQIDDLLVHFIMSKSLENAARTVKVYQIIANDKSFELSENPSECITNFARSPAARQKNKILAALKKAQ